MKSDLKKHRDSEMKSNSLATENIDLKNKLAYLQCMNVRAEKTLYKTLNQ